MSRITPKAQKGRGPSSRQPDWLDLSKLPKVAATKVQPFAVPPMRTGVQKYADNYVETPSGFIVPAVPQYVPETLLDRASVHRMEHELSKVCHKAGMDLREMRYQTSKRGSATPGGPQVIGEATFIVDFQDYNNVRHTGTAKCAIDAVGKVIMPTTFVIEGGQEVPLTVEGMRAVSEGIFFPTPIPNPLAPRQEVWKPELARELIHLGGLTKKAALTDQDIAALQRQFPKSTPEQQQQLTGLNSDQLPKVTSFADMGALDGGVVVSFSPQLMQMSEKSDTEFAYDTAKQWGYEIKGSPIYKQETDGVMYLAFLDDEKLGRLMEQLIERVSPTMEDQAAQDAFNEFLKSLNHQPTVLNNAVASALLERYNQATSKKLSMEVQASTKTAEKRDEKTALPTTSHDEVTSKKYQEQSVALQSKSDPDYGNKELTEESSGAPGFFRVPEHKLEERPLPKKAAVTRASVRLCTSKGPCEYLAEEALYCGKLDKDLSDVAWSENYPEGCHIIRQTLEGEASIRVQAQFKDKMLDTNLSMKTVDQLQMMLLDLAVRARTPLTFPMSQLYGMSREQLIEAIKNEMSKNFSVASAEGMTKDAGKATIQTMWLEDAADGSTLIKTKTETAPPLPAEGLTKEVPLETPLSGEEPGGLPASTEGAPPPGEVGGFSEELPSGLPAELPPAGASIEKTADLGGAEEMLKMYLKQRPGWEVQRAPYETPGTPTGPGKHIRAVVLDAEGVAHRLWYQPPGNWRLASVEKQSRAYRVEYLDTSGASKWSIVDAASDDLAGDTVYNRGGVQLIQKITQVAADQPPTTLREYKKRPEDVPAAEAQTAPEATPQMRTQFDEIRRAEMSIKEIEGSVAALQSKMQQEISQYEKESGKANEIASKQRAVEALAQLLETAKSRTAQLDSDLISLLDVEKEVPAKASPTWERDKLLERFGEEATAYLEKAKQGLQAMSTTVPVREVRVFPKPKTGSVEEITLGGIYAVVNYLAQYVDIVDNLIKGNV